MLDASGKAVFATSAVAGYGTKFFTWSIPPLGGGDGYTLRTSAVDLAGNRGETTSGRCDPQGQEAQEAGLGRRRADRARPSRR